MKAETTMTKIAMEIMDGTSNISMILIKKIMRKIIDITELPIGRRLLSICSSTLIFFYVPFKLHGDVISIS